MEQTPSPSEPTPAQLAFREIAAKYGGVYQPERCMYCFPLGLSEGPNGTTHYSECWVSLDDALDEQGVANIAARLAYLTTSRDW